MIFTSYFAQIPKIKTSNFGKNIVFINIARSKPNWITEEVFDLPDLFPLWDTVRRYKEGLISDVIYTEEYYKTVLDNLNPKKTLKLIESQKKSENDIVVLLCYETSFSFCHRHIISAWLNKQLDANIKEWGID